MDSTRQMEMVDRKGALTMGAVATDPHQRAIDASLRAGLPAEFREWLRLNWPIWDEFVKLADLMRNRGRAYYSARAVLHVLRWHRHLQDPTDEDFKINNRWSAPMARTYNRMLGVEFFRERDAG